MADRARAAAYELYKRMLKGAYSHLLSGDKSISSLSPRDRALASFIAFGTYERRLSIEYMLSKIFKTEPDEEIKALVYTGAFQIFYSERIPDRAVCSETVSIAKARFGEKVGGFINFVLRECSRRKKELVDSVNSKGGHIAASMNANLYGMIKEQYPGEAESICESLFGEADCYVRVNTLKANAEECAGLLNGEATGSDTVKCASADAVKHIESGLYFIQGLGSQHAVKLLDARPGDTIADVCACPGGKSFGAAINMRNEGVIYSFDIHENKLALIESGAKRLGISIIKTGRRDARITDKELENRFDKVICDVPCSGTGEMASKPEIKYKDPEKFTGLYETQQKIIESASKLLKRGGIMIYSTCSFNKLENECVVSRFLSDNKDFSLLYEHTFLPCNENREGFYTAKIKRE